MAMTRFRWAAVACTAAVFGGAVYVRAQVTTTDAPSLAAIASELRLLRQAVEKSTDTQTQIQALTAALSAQQSRLLQVSARAESLRKDVDAATAEHAVVTDYMTRLTNQMASGELSAEARDQASSELKAARGAEQKAEAKESQARTALIDAESAVQADLARWNDLMSRLDQMARR
jgi:chromosome segregation ATPase